MMTDFAIQVITSASVSAALAGLLLWITKSWISERLKNAIKSEYDLQLASHKAQLKAQSDVEIEKLRSQLSISAIEHEVRFSRLHEKRAEIIAETYSLLKLLFIRLNDYVMFFDRPDDLRMKRRRLATEAIKNFRSYYPTKLIFFPNKTEGKLQAIDIQLVSVFNEFTLGVETEKSGGGDGLDTWFRIVTRVTGEIETALGELEDEFRKLMGDDS